MSPFLSPIKALGKKAIDEQIPLDEATDTEVSRIHADFLRFLRDSPKLDLAYTAAATNVVNAFRPPSAETEAVPTLNTEKLGEVKGYKPGITVLDDGYVNLGFDLKLQSFDEIQSGLKNINDLPSNPQWIIERIGIGTGIKFDARHRLGLTAALVYDQDEPKLNSPDVELGLTYKFITRDAAGSLSVMGRTQHEDADPNSQVLGVKFGIQW